MIQVSPGSQPHLIVGYSSDGPTVLAQATDPEDENAIDATSFQ